MFHSIVVAIVTDTAVVHTAAATKRLHKCALRVELLAQRRGVAGALVRAVDSEGELHEQRSTDAADAVAHVRVDRGAEL